MKRRALHRLMAGNLVIGTVLAIGTIALAGCKMRGPMNQPNNVPDTPVPPIVISPPGNGADRDAGAPGAGNQNENNPAQNAPVTATLTVDKTTYNRGNRLNFTITAKNNSQTAQTLQFYSGQNFEITARPEPQGQQQSAVVWRWSNGMRFTMDMPQRVLAPGASQSWTAVWEQTDNNGNVVPRGRYVLEARIATRPFIVAAPVTVTLED